MTQKGDDLKILYARLSSVDHEKLRRLAAVETLQNSGRKKISMNRMVVLLIRRAATLRLSDPSQTPSETAKEASDEPGILVSASDRPPQAT